MDRNRRRISLSDPTVRQRSSQIAERFRPFQIQLHFEKLNPPSKNVALFDFERKLNT